MFIVAYNCTDDMRDVVYSMHKLGFLESLIH